MPQATCQEWQAISMSIQLSSIIACHGGASQRAEASEQFRFLREGTGA